MDIKRIHFPSIVSTNTWTKEHSAEIKDKDLWIVTADEQTGGRGRFKREWKSPAHENLYLTYGFLLSAAANNLSQMTSVIISHVLEELGFKPVLKWPNDILLNGKKVGGILCETTIENGKTVAIIGIGLNLNMQKDCCDKIDQPATSLLVESGNLFIPERIEEKITEKLLIALPHFKREGFKPFYNEFTARFFKKPGEKLTINTLQDKLEGTFVKINEDGSLVLNINNQEKTFYTGETVL